MAASLKSDGITIDKLLVTLEQTNSFHIIFRCTNTTNSL